MAAETNRLQQFLWQLFRAGSKLWAKTVISKACQGVVVVWSQQHLPCHRVQNMLIGARTIFPCWGNPCWHALNWFIAVSYFLLYQINLSGLCCEFSVWDGSVICLMFRWRFFLHSFQRRGSCHMPTYPIVLLGFYILSLAGAFPLLIPWRLLSCNRTCVTSIVLTVSAENNIFFFPQWLSQFLMTAESCGNLQVLQSKSRSLAAKLCMSTESVRVRPLLFWVGAGSLITMLLGEQWSALGDEALIFLLMCWDKWVSVQMQSLLALWHKEELSFVHC